MTSSLGEPAESLMPGKESLRQNIEQQLAVVGQLESLIEDEKDKLSARNWEAILTLADAKNELVENLQRLSARLQTAAGAAGLTATLKRFQLEQEHAALIARAANLQKANREARSILDQHQRRASAALQVFDRSAGQSATYGPKGHAGPRPQARHRACA